MVAAKAEVFPNQSLLRHVCIDPDDDKFLACALTGKCKLIVSGGKHLLRVAGYRGIKIIKPREFVNDYLSRLGKQPK
jgi:predicted nucleic acid-binding protein